ncbi:MAG: hypothetical protein ABW065_04990 [Solirubrobacterales bacterium]
MKGHRDLRLVVSAAFVCAILALAIPVEFLSLLFAAPLAFFLPGYAIAAATLVRQRPGRLQLLPLSLGLSLATLVLGSLLLNYLGGLRAGSWALLLVVVTVAAAVAAARRRPPAKAGGLGLRRPAATTLATAALGLLLAGIAVALAYAPFSASHAIGFTELWMQPQAAAVRVGVGNQQHTRTGYEVQVKFGLGAEPVSRKLELDPGEQATIRLAAPGGVPRAPLPVVATLFRADTPGVAYRRVNGWILPPGEPRR